MGLFSDIFGGGTGSLKTVKQQPWQKQGIDYLSGLLGAQAPLQGTAGMSPAEQQQQSILANVLAGGAFEDPSKSLYWQGLRGSMQQEEQQGVNALRQRAQLGGMLQSSPAAGAEGQYRATSANNRNTILGGLYNQERERDNPYTRLAAAQQYGSLPRLLQQAQLDAMYQQSMQPYANAQFAQSLMGHAPDTYMQQAQEGYIPRFLNAFTGPLKGILGGTSEANSGAAMQPNQYGSYDFNGLGW